MNKKVLNVIVVVLAIIALWLGFSGPREAKNDSNNISADLNIPSEAEMDELLDGVDAEMDEVLPDLGSEVAVSTGGGEVDIVEDIVIVRQYSNPALGIKVSVPEDWQVDEQSRPGLYTVRLYGEYPQGTLHFDIWAHRAKLDPITIGYGQKIGDATAYIAKTDCDRLGVICSGDTLTVPTADGETITEGNRTTWEVTVLDLVYGAIDGSDEASTEAFAAANSDTFQRIYDSLEFSF